MRKILNVALVLAGAFLFALCFPESARAQFTTVTATVTDPNGIPYAGGTMSAVLVPGASGGYTLNGAPYSGRVGPFTLDSTGSFTANFGDVTLITPGSPQWQITIDSNPGGIALPLGTGGQTFVYTSTGTTISGSSPVSLSVALTALAPKLTNFAGAGTGTIAGTVTAFHIPYVSAANTLADILGSAVTAATGAIALTAGADTTKPLQINSHSNTQSANLLDVNNQSGGTPNAPVVFRGRGFGSFDPGGASTILNIEQQSSATAAHGLIFTNRQASGSAAKLSTLELGVTDGGIAGIFGGNAVGDTNGFYGGLIFDSPIGTGVTAFLSNGGFTTEVPFAVENDTVGSTADLLDIKNSGGLVDFFDKNGALTVHAITDTGIATGTQCVHANSAGLFSGTGSDCAAGGGTVFPVTVSGTVNSGGIPCFTSTTNEASSAAIAVNDAIVGGGAGACAKDSLVPITRGASAVATNVAVGSGALAASTASTTRNTAIGSNALNAEASAAVANVAVGSNALLSESGSTGSNTAVGDGSLINLGTGNNDTGVGQGAGNQIVGGSQNTAVGSSSGPTTSALANTCSLGFNANPNTSNTCVIGNASVTDTWLGGVTGLSKVHGILGQSSTSQKSESAADTNVLTYTPIAAVGSYRLRFVMSVSAATSAVLGWTATWTDSNGNAQTPTNLTLIQSGTAVPALTFTAAGAGNYYGQADVDVNNSATNIVIKLTFTGTSFTAKVSASVERVI